ncbi:unnamed protein product, partial [Hymenolepis diminuta]
DEELEKLIKKRLETVKNRYKGKKLDSYPRRNLRFDEIVFRDISRSPLKECNTQKEMLIATFNYYKKLGIKYNNESMSNINIPTWCTESETLTRSKDLQSTLNKSDKNESESFLAKRLFDEFIQKIQ